MPGSPGGEGALRGATAGAPRDRRVRDRGVGSRASGVSAGNGKAGQEPTVSGAVRYLCVGGWTRCPRSPVADGVARWLRDGAGSPPRPPPPCLDSWKGVLGRGAWDRDGKDICQVVLCVGF